MNLDLDQLQNQNTPHRLWQAMFTGLSYLPWAWLLLMGCFTLTTTIYMGHFPTYGQPDPKDTGLLTLLYMPIIFSLPIILFSWLFWLLFGLSKHFLNLPIQIRRQEVIPFVSGYLVFIWFAVSDFAGLMTWLMD
jgi:hypothetical protein